MQIWQQLQTWFLAHWVVYGSIVLVFIINLIVSRKSQIDAWCEANPRVSSVLKILRGLGIDPWIIIQGIALLFTAKLPTDYKVLTAATEAKIGTTEMAKQVEDTKKIVKKEAEKYRWSHHDSRARRAEQHGQRMGQAMRSGAVMHRSIRSRLIEDMRKQHEAGDVKYEPASFWSREQLEEVIVQLADCLPRPAVDAAGPDPEPFA